MCPMCRHSALIQRVQQKWISAIVIFLYTAIGWLTDWQFHGQARPVPSLFCSKPNKINPLETKSNLVLLLIGTNSLQHQKTRRSTDDNRRIISMVQRNNFTTPNQVDSTLEEGGESSSNSAIITVNPERSQQGASAGCTQGEEIQLLLQTHKPLFLYISVAFCSEWLNYWILDLDVRGAAGFAT